MSTFAFKFPQLTNRIFGERHTGKSSIGISAIVEAMARQQHVLVLTNRSELKDLYETVIGQRISEFPFDHRPDLKFAHVCVAQSVINIKVLQEIQLVVVMDSVEDMCKTFNGPNYYIGISPNTFAILDRLAQRRVPFINIGSNHYAKREAAALWLDDMATMRRKLPMSIFVDHFQNEIRKMNTLAPEVQEMIVEGIKFGE